jgi:hypothetical protein
MRIASAEIALWFLVDAASDSRMKCGFGLQVVRSPGPIGTGTVFSKNETAGTVRILCARLHFQLQFGIKLFPECVNWC